MSLDAPWLRPIYQIDADLAEVYYARKFGLDAHLRHLGINDAAVIQQELNRIDGLVKFVAHHEPRMAATLKTQWSEILGISASKPSFAPKNQDRLPFYIFIDEAEFERADVKVLALGMTVSQHAAQIMSERNAVLESALADILGGRKHRIDQEKGTSFCGCGRRSTLRIR